MTRYPKKTSATLGSVPDFGPIPGKMLIPWVLMLGFIFLVCSSLNISLTWTFILGMYCILTWWLLVGRKNFRFFARIQRRSTPKWRKSRIVYQPLLSEKGGERRGDS